MKQLFYQRIIAITSLLFVGILLVQLFWVKSVYDYQRKEFDEKIGKVLIYVYQAIDPGDDLYERIKLVAQIDPAKNAPLVDSAYYRLPTNSCKKR